MKLVELAGMIPGLEVRRQTIGDNEAVSITGPYKLIAYALKFALYSGLLAIEQIARFGIKQDGTKCHLVLFQLPRVSMSKSLETTPIGVINGYYYAHMVATMQNGVNIAIFDKGFEPTDANGKAFGKFASAIFQGGKVRNSETNTMLLLGRAVRDRVLVASQWGKKNPLTTITQKLTGNVRYTTVQGYTILAAEYDTGCVAALHTDEVVRYFKESTIPTWQTKILGGLRIEDMTPSIGQSSTIAITARDDSDKRALKLAHIKWVKKDGEQVFQFVIDSKNTTDLSPDSAPVTRLTAKTVTAVDGNGGNAPRLTVADFADFDAKRAGDYNQLATAATSGRAYRAAFAAQQAA